MKKALFFSAAAFALLGASCSQDDAPRIGDGNAALRVSIPAEISTRYGQAATAPKLYVAIYKHAESPTETPTILFSNFPDNLVNAGDFTVSDFGNPDSDNMRTATVNVDLVKNQKYDIICWAQQPNATSYTFSPTAQTITVDYTNETDTPNTIDNYAEERDAFFGQSMDYTSEGKGGDIILKRPFAQINVGTSDWAKYKNAGGEATNPFGMTITGAATTLNLTDGSVSGTAEEITVTGAPAQEYATGNANNFPVTTGEYTYLDMAYVLVGDMVNEKGNLTVGLTGITGYPEWTEVPAKMNYRTNIFGNLLTNVEDFTITLDPNFTDSFNEDKNGAVMEFQNGMYVCIKPKLPAGVKAADLEGKGGVYIDAEGQPQYFPAVGSEISKVMAETDEIYLAPNVTITTGAHHLKIPTTGIIVHGNGAIISGGEQDFSFSSGNNYVNYDPGSVVNVTLENLNNVEVWGTCDVDCTFNFLLKNCTMDAGTPTGGRSLMMNRGGDTAPTVVNSTLENCYCKYGLNGIHQTYQGSLTVKNCTFENVSVPINIAKKMAGASMTVNIINTKFINCGVSPTDTANSTYNYAAPVRVVDNAGPADSTVLTITGCTFTGTLSEWDVLLMDYRDTKTWFPVKYTITNSGDPTVRAN